MLKRELKAQLGDEEITLVANFRASMKISEEVGDPLLIAREAALEAMFSRIGKQYDPKFRFTMRNVPVILHIGMEAGGDSRKLVEIQDLVFGAGIMVAQDLATRYIAMIVEPRSEEIASKLDAQDASKDVPVGE